MSYLYTPPMFRMVQALEGSLRYGITTCTLVYRQGGVWHNQATAGMDDPVVLDVDVDPSGLRLFFTRPTVVPDSLHDELAAVTAADPGWTPGSLELLA